VKRRYVTGHIWACPPSEGDDYIFHCHPPDQKIPKPKRLQEWYKKMLDKAFAERIIHDYKVCPVCFPNLFLWAGFIRHETVVVWYKGFSSQLGSAFS